MFPNTPERSRVRVGHPTTGCPRIFFAHRTTLPAPHLPCTSPTPALPPTRPHPGRRLARSQEEAVAAPPRRRSDAASVVLVRSALLHTTEPDRTQGGVWQGARRKLWQRHRDDAATQPASSWCGRHGRQLTNG